MDGQVGAPFDIDTRIGAAPAPHVQWGLAWSGIRESIEHPALAPYLPFLEIAIKVVFNVQMCTGSQIHTRISSRLRVLRTYLVGGEPTKAGQPLGCFGIAMNAAMPLASTSYIWACSLCICYYSSAAGTVYVHQRRSPGAYSRPMAFASQG